MQTDRLETSAGAGPSSSVASAAMGAILWLVAPLSPIGAPPTFGSIEHVFLLFPLVVAPLALRLLPALTGLGYRIIQHLQPLASALVLASFFLEKGAIAGALAAAWLCFAIAAAARGVRASSGPSVIAAHLFLVVGAVWLVLSRLGVGPRTFAPLTVFLAAVHFHFSGFALQVLIAATGRALLRPLAFVAMAGIPLIALGNALASPALKLAGVTAMVVASLGVAAASASVAHASRRPLAKGLLFASAASIGAAMVLAGVYGVGELTGRGWLGIPHMVTAHGLLNALGFTLCGLAGHVVLRRDASRDAVTSAALPRRP